MDLLAMTLNHNRSNGKGMDLLAPNAMTLNHNRSNNNNSNSNVDAAGSDSDSGSDEDENSEGLASPPVVEGSAAMGFDYLEELITGSFVSSPVDAVAN